MSIVDTRTIEVRDNREPMVAVDTAEFECVPQYHKQELTDDPTIYLREQVLEKLRTIKAGLPPGWNIRIWDGWRSLDVQQALFDRFRSQLAREHPDWSADELWRQTATFASDPTDPLHTPPHATGGAVDLTLVDGDGQQLEFGTGFDDFSERAHPNYFDTHAPSSKAEQEAKRNRTQLIYLMQEQDFSVDSNEWWHFNFGNQDWAVATERERAFYGATAPKDVKR